MESISLPENACYKVHCIRYLLHHYIGINLRSVDAGMPKKFARRVDVCPSCQGHCGKGVAACVKVTAASAKLADGLSAFPHSS